NDAAGYRIYQEHLPRLQTSFALYLFRWNGEHPGLGGHHDEIIVRHNVATGPQAVAIKGCADHATVSKRYCCRSIPWLHQRRMIFVESLLLRLDVRISRPRL